MKTQSMKLSLVLLALILSACSSTGEKLGLAAGAAEVTRVLFTNTKAGDLSTDAVTDGRCIGYGIRIGVQVDSVLESALQDRVVGCLLPVKLPGQSFPAYLQCAGEYLPACLQALPSTRVSFSGRPVEGGLQIYGLSRIRFH